MKTRKPPNKITADKNIASHNKENEKISKEAFIASETRYRRLFETAKDGIIILNADTGMIVDVNPYLIELLGYSREQFVEKAIWEIGFFKDIVANQEKFLELQQKEYVQYRDLPLETADGRQINVEFVSNVYFANHLKVIQCNIRDITERKQAENIIKLKTQELIKLNAEKDKFFSIIAHDLRSPFISFLGLTQVMAEKLNSLTIDEIQKIAVSMRDSATNLFRLLENLLQWAKLQQGSVPFTPEKIQLLPIVDESVAMIMDSASNKEIELTFDIPADIMVFADGNMLKTVIRNLVSNAVKFTPKGGKINIMSSASDDKNVVISIKDNGIGMSAEMIRDLFRIDIPTNRPGTEGELSTGVGLLLCKEFIENHSGKLWVESEEGKGSTFFLSLPHK